MFWISSDGINLLLIRQKLTLPKKRWTSLGIFYQGRGVWSRPKKLQAIIEKASQN
jgi:hypothetical protein